VVVAGKQVFGCEVHIHVKEINLHLLCSIMTQKTYYSYNCLLRKGMLQVHVTIKKQKPNLACKIAKVETAKIRGMEIHRDPR
jgi:hypothetical protein